MKILLIASLVLFVIACSLPVLELKQSNGTRDVMLGLRALAVGWSGVFAGVLAWYANPVWLIGVIMGGLRKPIAVAVSGIVALAIASTTFSLIGRELPADEGNVTKMTVIRILPGCYVWLASIAVLPLAALFCRPNP
ncbi:MAG: hypothetical protein U1E76_18165 [Planctomycetota bacterium]